MPATVVAERVGWERSIRVIRDREAELRPLFVPPDPCQRTLFALASSPSSTCGGQIPLSRLGQAKRTSCGCWSGFVASPGSSVRGWSRRARPTTCWAATSRSSASSGPPRVAGWYQEGCIGQWHGPKMVFSKEFQAFRGTLGMGARLCLRADPESNAFAERFVRTARAECLDWALVLGERHLDRVLREFVGHYNHERPHRGIDLEVPVPPPDRAALPDRGRCRATRPSRWAAPRVPPRRLT